MTGEKVEDENRRLLLSVYTTAGVRHTAETTRFVISHHESVGGVVTLHVLLGMTHNPLHPPRRIPSTQNLFSSQHINGSI